MYTESNKKEINWGSVIKKGLIILVVILLIFFIIWLLNNRKTNGINVDYGNQNNNSTLNESFYSTEFIDDYRYFHDTAKEYFLISELPKEGQTLKYTLKELIDKGLILPFGYKGKTCDFEASYALVTNVNGEYKLTITLVCGTEVAKTTEELGCNQLCTDGTCQNPTPSEPEEPDKVIEYEYKQPYTTDEKVYTCPSGYTKATQNGNVVCVKTTKTDVKATKTVTYYCPNDTDWVKSGSGDKTICTSKKKETVPAVEKVEYVCSNSDYVAVGDTCYKKTEDKPIPAKSYDVYDCPVGYEKSGTGVNMTCIRKAAATPIPTSCPSGWTEDGNNCIKLVDAEASCPSGYTYDYSVRSCVKQVAPTAIPYTTYTCDGIGGNLVGNKCVTTEIVDKPYYEIMPNCEYLGPFDSGTCTSKNCHVTVHRYSCPVEKPARAITNYNYVCPSNTVRTSGYGINTVCTIKDDSKIIYKCSSGTQYGISLCKITSPKATASICPYGYEPIANEPGMCYQATQPIVTKEYYCENKDYKLDGKYCYSTTKKTMPAEKKVTYTCAQGKLDGKTCVLDNEVRQAGKDIQYTCPSGYTKYNSGSSSMCVKSSTATTNPSVSTKTVTKYRYKWSIETELEGWTRTGNTRTREVSSK